MKKEVRGDPIEVCPVEVDGRHRYWREKDGQIVTGWLSKRPEDMHDPEAAGLWKIERDEEGQERITEDISYTSRVFVGASRAYGAGWDAVFGKKATALS